MVSSIAGVTISNLKSSMNEMSRMDSSQKSAFPGHFKQLISNIANTAMDSLQTAEALSVAKMEGADLDMRKIVNSILEAEQILSTTSAIRDKIVQSYLEISRMQI